MKNIKNLLLSGLIALALVGCGSDDSDSKASKTISGVALKADGSAFAQGSVVSAIDKNGNTAEGSVVDANGKFEITLVADASSGKKSRVDVEGNSFLRVTDGVDEMDLVIAEEQTNINFNVVTSAASALLIGSSGLDLDDLFDEVDDANVKKSKGLVTNPAILFAIAKVQKVTPDSFKSSATSVVGTLFGFDSTGKPAVNTDKLLTGSGEREVSLIVAAAKLDANLLSSVVNGVNSGTGLDLLGSDEFYAAVGAVLADAAGTASSNAFSDFLNSVVTSNEIKSALSDLATTLNAYVVAVELDATASLVVDIPTDLLDTPDYVSVEVAFVGDNITCTTTTSGDGSVQANDASTVSVAVVSSTDVEAVISVKLTANSTGGLTSGNAEIIVTTDTVSVTVSGSGAVTSSGTVTTIDLVKAMSDAADKLEEAGYADLASKVPSSTNGLSFSVAGTPVVRNNQVVPTYITTSGGSSVTSSYGVVFE